MPAAQIGVGSHRSFLCLISCCPFLFQQLMVKSCQVTCNSSHGLCCFKPLSMHNLPLLKTALLNPLTGLTSLYMLFNSAISSGGLIGICFSFLTLYCKLRLAFPTPFLDWKLLEGTDLYLAVVFQVPRVVPGMH